MSATSEDDERLARTRRAYRLTSVPFAVATIGLVWLGVTMPDIGGGAVFIAPLLGITTVGLWLVRSWGRSIAIVVVMGHGGLAGLAIVAGLVEDGVLQPGPLVLLAVAGGLAYVLTRPVFALPEEER